MKKVELYFGLLKLPFDFVAVVLAFMSAYHFRTTDFVLKFLSPVTQASFYFERDNFILHYAAPLALVLLFILALNRQYSFKQGAGIGANVGVIVSSVLIWLASIISYFFLIRDFPFSRFVLLVGAVFSLVYVLIFRLFIRQFRVWLLKKGVGRKEVVLVVSDRKPLRKVIASLKSDLRYVVVGYISEQKLKIKSVNFLGGLSKLEEIIADQNFDELIQVGTLESQYKNVDLLDMCRFYHKEYSFLPDVFEVQKHNIDLTEISGLPIFKIKPTPLDGWGRIVKRVFDIVASGLGLLVLWPLFAVVAVLIKLDSKGPVLFKYAEDGKIVYRIGQKGKPFYCFKFRTMKVNSHYSRYNELAEKDIRKGSPLVKIKDDPRVTKLGLFLRRFDIDELPQLWNVFKGEMSLIGPRPHLTEEVEKYHKHHKFVLTVKPGITGMAQVSGRSDLDFEDEVKLDTFYIENWSLWLDMKILLKTVLVVFKGHNEFSK